MELRGCQLSKVDTDSDVFRDFQRKLYTEHPAYKFQYFNRWITQIINFDAFEGFKDVKWQVRITKERFDDIYKALLLLNNKKLQSNQNTRTLINNIHQVVDSIVAFARG